MTDETQTTEETTEDPKIEEATSDKMVPAHRLEAVEAQAGEWKAKFREMEKRLATIDEAEAAAEEERARKAGEFEKIEASLKEKLEAKERETSALLGQIERSALENKLMAAGFKDEHGDLLAGVLDRRMASEEPSADVEAWVESLRTKYPPMFGKAETPSTRAGSPDHGSDTGDTLEKDLESEDLAVRSAAIRKRREMREAGLLK